MATKKSKSKWVCGHCLKPFGGPRDLGEHYKASPVHGTKSVHPRTRQYYQGLVAKAKVTRVVNGNKYDRELVRKVLDRVDTEKLNSSEFSNLTGVNRNYIYKLRERNGAAFLHKDTRTKLENFIGKDLPSKEPVSTGTDDLGLPTVEAQVPIRRLAFCTSCGARFATSWNHCGHCGARRATV